MVVSEIKKIGNYRSIDFFDNFKLKYNLKVQNIKEKFKLQNKIFAQTTQRLPTAVTSCSRKASKEVEIVSRAIGDAGYQLLSLFRTPLFLPQRNPFQRLANFRNKDR